MIGNEAAEELNFKLWWFKTKPCYSFAITRLIGGPMDYTLKRRFENAQ
jgi:hypothetical protein